MRKHPIGIAALELAFWAPFSVIPFYAMVRTGVPLSRIDILYSISLTAMFATADAYFRRLFLLFRLSVLMVLGLGSIIATAMTVISLGGLDPMTFFAAVDTDMVEATEFLRHKVDSILFCLILILPTVAIPLAATLVQHKWKLYWSPPKAIVCLLIGSYAALFAIQQYRLHNSSSLDGALAAILAGFPSELKLGNFPPLYPYEAFNYVRKIRSDLLSLADSNRPVEGLSSTAKAQGPRTYVVIIGESLSKFHMSLYGYDRPTTPRLAALSAANEIAVFQDVVTGDAHTVGSLKAALRITAGPQNEPRTIISLFNSAGFKTYWLSNQYSSGIGESAISILTRSAQSRTWIDRKPAIDFKYRDKDFDEILLPKLREALASNAVNKVIFLHLIGNHFDYKFRYPPKHRQIFDPAVVRPCLTPEEAQLINDYDNSIYYNDFLVTEIIETVRKTAGESFVVYFSDHGDEVYDFRRYYGHMDELLSPYMVKVPLILWLSPEYRGRHRDVVSRLAHAVARPYSLEDLSYTLTDLAHLTLPGMDPTRSIVSSQFSERPRVTAGLDIDAFLRSWQPDTAHAGNIRVLTCSLPIDPAASAPAQASTHAEEHRGSQAGTAEMDGKKLN